MSPAPGDEGGGIPLRVNCPRCGESTGYQGNPWRPFCSERCKLIDLGRWAEEKYVIPTDDTPPEEGE